MMEVNVTFNRVISGRYASRISWAGNLTSSLARFILQYVQPEDDGGRVWDTFRVRVPTYIIHLLDSVKIKEVEKRKLCSKTMHASSSASCITLYACS